MEDGAMPETYSHGEATRPDDAAELRWDTIFFDWPIEIVVAETEVVVSREPSALEWVVVRIFQEFADPAPTLVEAAEELGLGDPVFLVETLQSLSSSGLIERTGSPGEPDFANCRLTEAGQAFLEQGRPSGIPERHGLRLYLDLITGAHLRPPRPLQAEPKNPIVPRHALPARRTTIGLDHARELAADQEEPFLTAASSIANVTVQYEEGSIGWSPCEVLVSIDQAGILRCQLLRGTEEQQQWLEQLDLRHEAFARLFSSSLRAPDAHLLPPAKSPRDWRPTVDRLVSPARVGPEACDLLRSARHEVLAHVAWLTRPEVRRALSAAAARGVRPILFGHPSQVAEVPTYGANTATVLSGSVPGVHGQTALLVDGSTGLSLDRVHLSSPRQRKFEVVVASSLRPDRVAQLQQELLATASGDPFSPVLERSTS
jgi:hypothetical protein